MLKLTAALAASAVVLVLSRPSNAQPANPSAPAEPGAPADPAAPPPAIEPLPPDPASPPSPSPPPPAPLQETSESVAPVQPPREEEPEPMSEGRRIVVAYNTGFQWGLSPGVVFSGGKTSFFLGLRLGYGFDTGRVIVVPGVRLSGYFSDPNVYVGMPVVKLVYPIDRFAPFVEGGAGAGYIAEYNVNRTTLPAETGVALFAGVGFMVHFSWKFGLGVEGTYQTITGTDFSGFGIGPIIALAF